MIAGLGARIGAGFAIAGAVLLAILKIRSDGRAAERAEQAQRDNEAKGKADEVERSVARAGDTQLDGLRRKWTRRG